MMNPRSPVLSVSLIAGILTACFFVFGCGKSKPSGQGSQTLNTARSGFTTKLLKQESREDFPPPTPPVEIFDLIHYPSPAGELAAYISPDPGDGKKHPLVIWLTGGFGNSLSSLPWQEGISPDNDQSASGYRKAGIAMMYPSLRGGNNNPGAKEGLYGEVDDVLAAAKHAAAQPWVDTSRIYLGGHSTGGTLALLAAEAAPEGLFRAVISFGPVANASDYGQDNVPYDITNAKESEVRSPVKFLADIKSKTFVLEGGEGNIESLQEIRRANTNGRVVVHAVDGATHFSILQPLNSLFADKIPEDRGEHCSISLTASEIDTAVANVGKAKLLLPGDVRRTIGRTALVFYYSGDSVASSGDHFRKALKKSMPDFPVIADLKDAPEPPFIILTETNLPSEDFSLPDEQTLEFAGRGLGAADKRILLASKKALMAGLVTPYPSVWKDTKTFNKFAASHAKETGAYILDMATREYFSQTAWDAKRVGGWGDGEIPDIRNQITIHLYPRDDADGYLRAVTLGMEKFALPDVAIEKLISSDNRSAGNLINVFCQTLTSSPIIEDPAHFIVSLDDMEPSSLRQGYRENLLERGTGMATLAVFRGTPDEGDPENDQVSLAFSNSQGNTEDERRSACLAEFWGATDPVIRVGHDDEIEKISAAAKVKFLALKERFAAGLPPDSHLMAKTGFPADDGGKEWMWIEVMTWDEKGTLDGLLQNDPNGIKGLRAGAKVSAKAAEIFDYLLVHPDGSKEGNETGALLEKKSR